MAEMTQRAKELLKQVGRRGCRGSDVAEDDATMDALNDLTEAGYIISTPARFDDYFELTKAGRAALKAGE